MKIKRLSFKEGERPLKNNTFIDNDHKGHEGFNMTLVDGFVYIKYKGKDYMVPTTSISHMELARSPVFDENGKLTGYTDGSESDKVKSPGPKAKAPAKPKKKPAVEASGALRI